MDTLSRFFKLDHEIRALSMSSVSRCTIAQFSPHHIKQFSPDRLAGVHRRCGPILTAVLMNLAKVNTGADIRVGSYMEGALRLDGGLQEAVRGRDNKGAKHQHPRDSSIIVTTALSMLC